MRLSDLPAVTVEKIRSRRYDRIVEKHEGPERWTDVLDYYEPELLTIGPHAVLLPIDRERHPNVTVLRHMLADDGNSLICFLKDTTYGTDWFDSGFLAICDKLPGEELFVAIVYHEWFIIEGQ